MKRPPVTGMGTSVTTPRAEAMIRLLGPGMNHSGITLTRDEARALNKLYGMKPEVPNERPPKPVRKPDPDGTPEFKRREADAAHKRALAAWEKWEDPQAFLQAGADRNMMRHAEADGLRLVAWLAKYIPPGLDPLKTLIQLGVEAGFDVADEDIAWADDD